MRHALNRIIVERLSVDQRHRLQRLRHPALVGLDPVSRTYGYDRGTPIDRYYIERFLGEHRDDVQGNVVEVKDSAYTRLFGSHVLKSDVLDINRTNRDATVLFDLGARDAEITQQYDCFLLTQTLQFVYDTRAAVKNVYRLLRPSGVLLATVPGISQVDPSLSNIDFWRFTSTSCVQLFGHMFGFDNVSVQTYGNGATSVAFLRGMAHEELTRRQLDVHDDHYPLVICIRAVKS